MSNRLENRVVIITGGAHGIGKAYALRMAEEGANIVIADLDEAGAVAVAEELKAKGIEALGVKADVSDEANMLALAAATVEKFGRIDALVNNAAVFSVVPMSRSPFDQIEQNEWDLMMRVNVKGPWLAARAVAPQMRQQGYGKIVNISSGTALKGSPSRIHYVTSKAAVIGFTKTLANELGKDNICVNCVAPGSTLSEEHPDEDVIKMRGDATKTRALKRVQTPEDLTGAVLFFVSGESDFITGQTLVVDGGSCMH
jgi:3-oxoacyl-[acyl-carrier protein] reductase